MKLLITGAYPLTPERRKDFEDRNYTVLFHQDERAPLSADLLDADAVICNGLFLYHDIDSFPHLKYIQLTSAGLDRVPLERIRQRGITINNARGVYSLPMAEWAVTKILDIYKNTPFFIANQQQKTWNKDRTLKELAGRNIAILGAGNVGTTVARLLKAFDTTVFGFDKYPRPSDTFDVVKPVSDFKPSLPLFDIVILTAPLTPETRHFIDGPTILTLKPEAILLNISRGALIDQDALPQVLIERPDLTAILDVFEQEPLPADSPLWTLPNLHISPHNSFVSQANPYRLHTLTLTLLPFPSPRPS